MNQFEQLIRILLEQKGYWVKTNVKVNLSKEDKARLGKPSMPRPDIDVVALCMKTNTLYLLEVKSYLDSNGVYPEHVTHSTPRWDKYKLLTNDMYRDLVIGTLRQALLNSGECNEETKVKVGLIAAKVHKNRIDTLKEYCHNADMFFWGPDDIGQGLRDLEKQGYADNMAMIITKLLLRN